MPRRFLKRLLRSADKAAHPPALPHRPCSYYFMSVFRLDLQISHFPNRPIVRPCFLQTL
jgi:hypothetical protein